MQKRKRRLPVVLSEAEVARLLAAPMSLKTWTTVMTLYAAALRLDEAVHLQPGDIDSESMCIRVREGKGGRDPTVMLAGKLVALRDYWRIYLPGPWLFYAKSKDRPIDPRTVQKAILLRGQAHTATARRPTRARPVRGPISPSFGC